MVELRKRPPPKEPPAPPPAAKKRGPKPKAGANSKASGSITEKAKEAATKVKEAVVGDTNKDKQPTVEDAATPGDDAPKSATAPAPTTSTGTSAPVDNNHSSSAGLASATAGGVSAANVAHAAPPGPAVPASMPPTEATKAQDDPNRAETPEALENPPETGKVEPATTTAQSAVVAGGLGPASSGPGASAASGSANVPLSAESVGKLITLEGFGGTVETHDGRKVSVKDLLGEGAAKGGLVIFTYPRASTPGCTQQACLFRDNYQPITASGLAVYGLSTDSTKANSNFATKQSLPFPLLCDPQASLTGAIGMKKPGGGNSTTRGVVVIDGQGVVKAWFQGGPAKTLDVVMEFVKTMGK